MPGTRIVGVWMVDSPIGRAIAVYSAEGSVISALAASQAGPAGCDVLQYPDRDVGAHQRARHPLDRCPTALGRSGRIRWLGHGRCFSGGQRGWADLDVWGRIDHHDPRRDGQRRPGDRRRATCIGRPDGRGCARLPGGNAHGCHPGGVTRGRREHGSGPGSIVPGPFRWPDQEGAKTRSRCWASPLSAQRAEGASAHIGLQANPSGARDNLLTSGPTITSTLFVRILLSHR